MGFITVALSFYIVVLGCVTLAPHALTEYKSLVKCVVLLKKDL